MIVLRPYPPLFLQRCAITNLYIISRHNVPSALDAFFKIKHQFSRPSIGGNRQSSQIQPTSYQLFAFSTQQIAQKATQIALPCFGNGSAYGIGGCPRDGLNCCFCNRLPATILFIIAPNRIPKPATLLRIVG